MNRWSCRAVVPEVLERVSRESAITIPSNSAHFTEFLSELYCGHKGKKKSL